MKMKFKISEHKLVIKATFYHYKKKAI